MSENIDTRVTPALHPINVKEVDGYDETVAHLLAPAETAFSEAYLGLISIHDARAAAARNPAWNEPMQLINTQDFADKVFARAAKCFDTVTANLVNNIGHIEAELSAPVASKASQSVSGEIRTYVRNLPDAKRIGFVTQLIEAGDADSVSAVLGGPAFLSGMTNEMKSVLTRMFHEKANPDAAKRLKVMKGGVELIGRNGGLLFKELEKAVGASPHKVAKMREAHNAAQKAFTFKNA